MNTLSPLTELKGIGEKTEKLFAKVGVTNVGELLSYYPRTYETYGEIPVFQESFLQLFDFWVACH